MKVIAGLLEMVAFCAIVLALGAFFSDAVPLGVLLIIIAFVIGALGNALAQPPKYRRKGGFEVWEKEKNWLERLFS